jgi:hypothetical protein
MTQVKAEMLQKVFGGEAKHTRGGIWLLFIENDHGLTVFSEENVALYGDWDSYYSGNTINEIAFGE